MGGRNVVCPRGFGLHPSDSSDVGYFLVTTHKVRFHGLSADYANKMDATHVALGKMLKLASTRADDPGSPRARTNQVRKQRRKAFTPDEIKRLVADYGAGISIEALAMKYRCHRATVLKYTADAGVHRPKQFKVAPAQVVEMVRLYESGMATGEIGLRLGFSTKTVRRRLKATGAYPGPCEL